MKERVAIPIPLSRSARVALALGLAVACGLDTDRDGDGYYAAADLEGLVQYDCDDYDPDVNQGEAWYPDADEDGLGDSASEPCYLCAETGATPRPSSAEEEGLVCNTEIAWVFNALDCDDDDDEQGRGVYYYRDLDDDGYGDPDISLAYLSCPLDAGDSVPSGYADNALDCDDSEEASDDGDIATVYYLDADGDGYGGDTTLTTCDADLVPSDYVTEGEDCDDTVATINPGEPDCANDRDDDCDDREDEDEVRTWYYDGDGDGYGDPDVTQVQCPPDDLYIDTGGDCDDTDETNYPGIDDCPDVAEP